MLTLNQAANILKQDQLLREIVIDNDWRFEIPANLKDRKLQFLSYDSRRIEPDTLFMCKGTLTKNIWRMRLKREPLPA